MISTPCKTASSATARILTSLAMAKGACSGIRYIDASHCLVFQGHPSLCMSTSCARCFSTRAFAASLLIPSLPATTHEMSHIPHTNRSFPSFIQPHRAAATASIADGLFAYVASLKVERRVRNDCIEDGRYSVVDAVAPFVGGAAGASLKGSAFRVRNAVRASIAAKCGAAFDKDSYSLVIDFVSFLIPYFASVAYNDFPVLGLFAGGC